MTAQAHYETPEFTHRTEAEHQALAKEITRLAGHINAANYRFLKLVAEFDRTGGWSGIGIRSCAHWLAWKCGMGEGAARAKVRVARKLEELPQIDAAFATGQLSYSVVRCLTKVATPATERYYLDIAEWCTASQLEKLVRQHRWAKRMQEKHREELQQEDRRASWYIDDDGMWVITARLPAAEGELVAKTLQAIVDTEDDEIHEHAISEEEYSDASKPIKTMAQKRADALSHLAEHVTARGDTLKDLKGSERCQVMLHVDIKTLQKHSQPSADHNHCCIGEENWLHPHTARRLSCDASLVTVLEDEKGNVLNIGRRSRIIPPSLKRALDIRDGGCRFPGCNCRLYTDGHHIVHWADGGETSLDNLVTLCRFHHRRLHMGEFTVEPHPDFESEFLFKDKSGKEIVPTFRPMFDDHDVSRDAAQRDTLDIEEENPDVSADTCVTKWMGERMDLPYAVGTIMDLEEYTASQSPGG